MFDIIEPFADYSFNKSHTVGYGLVTYQTAYLKANHPREYLAALLTSVKGDKDKSAVYLNECRQLEIDGARARRQRVRHGLRGAQTTDRHAEGGRRPRSRRSASGSRRCATSARASSRKIVEARDEGGPFTDFYDFCERVDPIAC